MGRGVSKEWNSQLAKWGSIYPIGKLSVGLKVERNLSNTTPIKKNILL